MALVYPWAKGENMSEISAYEKMFEDGSAFEKIEIAQPTPDNPGGGMSGGDPDSPGVDYSLFDNHMDGMIKEKIEAKKAAALGNPARPDPPPSPMAPGATDKMIRLEKRIELLEQALSLVMETQTKLMRG